MKKKTARSSGRKATRIGKIGSVLFFLARLLIALLLLSCLSPVPPTSVPKQETFADEVASFPGPLRLIIWKSQYTVTLYKGDTPLRTYRAVFGKGYQDGDKRMQGDKRTPEGEFYICTMNHSKRFYKFMGLSYPDVKHAEEGFKSGVISRAEYRSIKKAIAERQTPPWSTRLGGAVGIHGRSLESTSPQPSFVGMNWTDGCIALDNADVDELFSVVALGTPVTILP
jgi:murein L,D-transpeptidase YafK